MEDHAPYHTSGKNEETSTIITLWFSFYLFMKVLKKHVDNYKPGCRIPSCQLSAVFTLANDKPIPLLQYQVKLEGAKEPFNMIAIELPTISGIYRDACIYL